MFKERPTKKLTERYVGPYTIEEVVSLNAVKLRLPSSMRIHPVINVSRIVHYKEQVKGQKKEEGKLIEVKGIEEWEVEKIFNMVEGIYGRGGYLGKERKPKKHGRID